MVEMGYEFTDIKDFIEDKGLPVLSHELLADSLESASYRNPLYVPPQGQNNMSMAPQGQPVNFGYFDPSQ